MHIKTHTKKQRELRTREPGYAREDVHARRGCDVAVEVFERVLDAS